jgi:hypothetical protein
MLSPAVYIVLMLLLLLTSKLLLASLLYIIRFLAIAGFPDSVEGVSLIFATFVGNLSLLLASILLLVFLPLLVSLMLLAFLLLLV